MAEVRAAARPPAEPRSSCRVSSDTMTSSMTPCSATCAFTFNTRVAAMRPLFDFDFAAGMVPTKRRGTGADRSVELYRRGGRVECNRYMGARRRHRDLSDWRGAIAVEGDTKVWDTGDGRLLRRGGKVFVETTASRRNGSRARGGGAEGDADLIRARRRC